MTSMLALHLFDGISLFCVRLLHHIRELLWGIGDLYFTPTIIFEGVSLFLFRVWDPIRELVRVVRDLHFIVQF